MIPDIKALIEAVSVQLNVQILVAICSPFLSSHCESTVQLLRINKAQDPNCPDYGLQDTPRHRVLMCPIYSSTQLNFININARAVETASCIHLLGHLMNEVAPNK